MFIINHVNTLYKIILLTPFVNIYDIINIYKRYYLYVYYSKYGDVIYEKILY